jgi:hypothetical protein
LHPNSCEKDGLKQDSGSWLGRRSVRTNRAVLLAGDVTLLSRK